MAATAVLVALALPALGMKTVVPGAEALPQDLPAVQTYNRLQAAFPGEQDPATVVVRAPSVDTPEVKSAIAELQKQALAAGHVHQPVTVDVNDARTVAQIDLPIDGTGTDAASNAALASLREDIVPATIGAVDGVEVGVTGTTAISKDFDSSMRSTAPLVFAFVLAFAFVLLLVSFRSIVLAVKAIVLNLLSVAAAYGVLVLVFQHSWAKGILGFDYSGGVMAFMPVFLFVILFGLSMDYHVFILSRIREAYDRGMKTEDAVAHGIKTTAGVVTSAAIVMVFVFGIFATLSIVMLKQFGVGLATAVLIDATIVRAVLLPAAMMLLGDWNWYLPRWLEWLPKLEHERSAEVAPRARARAREARGLSSTTSGVGSRTRPPSGPPGWRVGPGQIRAPREVAHPSRRLGRLPSARRRSSSAGQSTALVKRGPRVRIPSPALPVLYTRPTCRRIHASASGAARRSVGGSSSRPCPAPGKTTIFQSLSRRCLDPPQRLRAGPAGTLRSAPPKSQSAGTPSRSRNGDGSKPDRGHDGISRAISSVLRPPSPASCSNRATMLCRRTPGLAIATNRTWPDCSAARGAIQPAALAPRNPTRAPSTSGDARTAATAPTASEVTRLNRPYSSGQQRPSDSPGRACRRRRTRSRLRHMRRRAARR